MNALGDKVSSFFHAPTTGSYLKNSLFANDDKDMMKITGTFVQPLCGGEIPLLNWEYEEWDRELALMKAVGIDTIILLRAALGKWASFQSRTLSEQLNCYPSSFDYVKMFLDLAEKHAMKMFVPTFSDNDWNQPDYDVDARLSIQKSLVSELWSRYGSSPAFAGWYFAHEFMRRDAFRVIELFQKLAPWCRQLSGPLPILMSPYMNGPKSYPYTEDYALRKNKAITPQCHEEEWDWIMGELEGVVDIIAFQDGHVDYDDLGTFLEINARLARKHHIDCWSNIELFDRDNAELILRPLAWEKLRLKLNITDPIGFSKFICYEFVPFMSPHGTYIESRFLLKRYCEFQHLAFPEGALS